MTTKALLQVGTTQFAPSASALVDTLFTNGGTANGTYKVKRNGILFSKANGEPFAFLVANRHGERFFVSCSRQEDGKIRYMFGISKREEMLLGIREMGWTALHDEADRVWQTANGGAQHP